jgi:ATP-dependent Lon protease
MSGYFETKYPFLWFCIGPWRMDSTLSPLVQHCQIQFWVWSRSRNIDFSRLFNIEMIRFTYDIVPAILSTPDAEARLRLATEIFIKQASISEVSKKIATAVDESLSKQQKEFFLRQQLAAIQRELHALQKSNGIMSVNQIPSNPSNTNNEAGSISELDDDEQHEVDDMADLKKRIEAMAHDSEERKMGVREWRRLKRIPAGSVENGVIRSYVSFFLPLSLSIYQITKINLLQA